MVKLIPILEKFSLKYDSCSADAAIQDSLLINLNIQVEYYLISLSLKDAVIDRLGEIIDENDLVVKRKDKKIKIVRKKAFWNGFAFGGGTVTVGVILILVLLL